MGLSFETKRFKGEGPTLEGRRKLGAQGGGCRAQGGVQGVPEIKWWVEIMDINCFCCFVEKLGRDDWPPSYLKKTKGSHRWSPTRRKWRRLQLWVDIDGWVPSSTVLPRSHNNARLKLEIWLFYMNNSPLNEWLEGLIHVLEAIRFIYYKTVVSTK